MCVSRRAGGPARRACARLSPRVFRDAQAARGGHKRHPAVEQAEAASQHDRPKRKRSLDAQVALPRLACHKVRKAIERGKHGGVAKLACARDARGLRQVQASRCARSSAAVRPGGLAGAASGASQVAVSGHAPRSATEASLSSGSTARPWSPAAAAAAASVEQRSRRSSQPSALMAAWRRRTAATRQCGRRRPRARHAAHRRRLGKAPKVAPKPCSWPADAPPALLTCQRAEVARAGA